MWSVICVDYLPLLAYLHKLRALPKENLHPQLNSIYLRLYVDIYKRLYEYKNIQPTLDDFTFLTLLSFANKPPRLFNSYFILLLMYK